MDHPRSAWNPLGSLQNADYICKLIKRCLGLLIHFPYYHHDELVGRMSEISQVATEEFKEYEECSSKVKSAGRQIAIVLICSIYALKLFYQPWITVRTIDFKEKSLNSTNPWIKDNTVAAFCMQTNCTQFFYPGTNYSMDIRHFPILPFCYPRLSRFYTPVIFLGPYSMLLHGVVGCCVLIWGVVMPLIHLHSPVECETMMFLVAPELTRNLMIMNAKRIYEDFLTSDKNYLKKVEEDEVKSQASLAGYWRSRKRYTVCFLSDIHTTSEQEGQLDRSSMNTPEEVYPSSTQPEFVQDCLPGIRTSKWHPEAQRILIKGFLIVGLCIGIEVSLELVDLTRRLIIKSHEYELMQNEIYRSGCKNWYITASGAKDVIPPHPTLSLRWNFLSWADNVVLVIVYGLAGCFVSVYYMINCELDYWLREIHYELEILIEISRSQVAEDSNRNRAKCISNGVQLTYGRKTRHDQHRINIPEWFDLPKNRSDRKKLIGKMSLQQLVSEKLSDTELTADAYLNLMIRLYISFRLFMDQVERCSKVIPLLSLGSYLATFVVVFVTVWHSRLVRQFGYEHILITASCCFWAGALAILMSDFHAKVSISNFEYQSEYDNCLLTNFVQSGETERYFWTLIAVLSERSAYNKRVRHLRLLWLKQLIAISDEGGILLKIYGMRVTYVNALQVRYRSSSRIHRFRT